MYIDQLLAIHLHLLANLQSRSLYATIQRTLIADPLVPITVHETADNLSALGSQPGQCLRTVAGEINDFAGGGRIFYCRGSSGLLESIRCCDCLAASTKCSEKKSHSLP